MDLVADLDRQVREVADTTEQATMEVGIPVLGGHHGDDGTDGTGAEAPEMQVRDQVALSPGALELGPPRVHDEGWGPRLRGGALQVYPAVISRGYRNG
ncbi:hypothetical protein GCM10007887_18510 [Methylobacterium haplocladii]|uniref:Uncharacterized protein n=1 Tax=Methylobacterium haplocladii TaxID=1176176 RepID=A0A512IV17_9HYPH|nr:hypothetical protein MHA02_39200 [Methylobacterium haplocladii]GLS59185.1 hypothetical protein GCM10007887_18510 [Methylobacterium haplocladii]